MTSAAAGHDAKGQQWGLKARTTRMPQAPRTWIRTEDRRQPRIIGVPPHLAGSHAREHRGRADRRAQQ